MALIKPKIKQNKVQARISLNESLMTEIKAYCDWANIEKIDDFIEQAIEFVFSKDKSWKVQQSRKNVAG